MSTEVDGGRKEHWFSLPAWHSPPTHPYIHSLCPPPPLPAPGPRTPMGVRVGGCGGPDDLGLISLSQNGSSDVVVAQPSWWACYGCRVRVGF